MRELAIQELPQCSAWPARLLGLEAFAQRKRDTGQIEREYNQDKYKRCLESYRKTGEDPWRMQFFHVESDGERDGVIGDKLVAVTHAEMIEAFFEALIAGLREPIEASKTVVELGCGFGSNLRRLARTFDGKLWRGGDWSENAVELAGALDADTPELEVSRLDFYHPPYACLDDAEGPVTVFTSAAIEQLPSVEPLIDALGRYRAKIAWVVHLEPAYDLHGESLLGLMRRRYAEINDYNRDLVSVLRARPDISIERIEHNVFGFNAFNPLSLVRWRFADAG